MSDGILSLKRRGILVWRHLVSRNRADKEPPHSEPDRVWFDAISAINRQLLGLSEDESRDRHSQTASLSPRSSTDPSWKRALNTLAAECSHRIWGDRRDLDALEAYFDLHIDKSGDWKTPFDRVEHAMKGYTLLYLAEATDHARYRQAAEALAASLLREHPRASDRALPYDPLSKAVLVDSLAMVCPFLARYARLLDDRQALATSVNQLIRFVQCNIDPDTHLPYHGYYADGPRRLGLHGWGRGTGWYMLGLVDTVSEMSPGDPGYGELRNAYVTTAAALPGFQRDDGHWSWAIPHRHDRHDSSTTSLLAYSLMRGIEIGLIDDSFMRVVANAARALVRVTRPDGVLDGGLGECRGLGKHPQQYGPQPWLQGSATAFAALYLMLREGRLT